MDNKRLIFWGTLGVLIWLNFITWQHDYPDATSSPTITSAQSTPPLASTVPAPSTSSGDNSSVSSTTPTTSAPTNVVATGSKIHVATDVLDLDINTRGGDLERADLVKYQDKEDPKKLVRLLDDQPDHLFVVHSGLSSDISTGAPTEKDIFTSDASQYRLEQDKNELQINLHWTNGQGIEVTKTFIFHRGSYAINIRYTVNNTSTTVWHAASYVDLYRLDVPQKRSMFNAETMSYRGPAIYDGKKYQKLDLSSEQNKDFKTSFTGGWIAALQHHFVVAAVPPTEDLYDSTLRSDKLANFSLTTRGPSITVEPGQQKTFNENLFVGPKLQSQLSALGSELQRTTDFGKLYLIAQPLFDVLQFVHKATGNWGVDIIIVTLLIKLAFYWLTASSGRSMAKMRTLAPKLKALQERYKDDREHLGRATMELYKKEKVNPVAGCLPMLIQMPFFMAFYFMLLESAELHQAPFFGWITDLSARDPYFVLPIIMGIANFVQFKVNPPQADPTQAKIMAFMPIVMTVMMAWFPAGLLLYWVTNTIVSALQQWRINKLVEIDNQRQKS